MYDPIIGRFLQEDPIWPDTGEANPFLYTQNSPTNATDPSGMEYIATETEARAKVIEATMTAAGVETRTDKLGSGIYRIRATRVKGDPGADVNAAIDKAFAATQPAFEKNKNDPEVLYLRHVYRAMKPNSADNFLFFGDSAKDVKFRPISLNRIDILGFEEFLKGGFTAGVVVDPKEYGGGKVQVQNGPVGTITVRLGRHQIDSDKKDAVRTDPVAAFAELLPLLDDKKPTDVVKEKIKALESKLGLGVKNGGINIIYEGTHASELAFIQFVYYSVQYTHKPKSAAKDEKAPGVTTYFKCAPGNSGSRDLSDVFHSTTDPKRPWLWTDNHGIDRDDKSRKPNLSEPRYGLPEKSHSPIFRWSKGVAMTDDPQSPLHTLYSFLSDYRRGEVNIGSAVLTEVRVNQTFETYLVYQGRPIYQIVWGQDLIYNLSFPDKSVWPTGLKVYRGGPVTHFGDKQAHSLSDKDYLDFIKGRFPEQKVIIPAP